MSDFINCKATSFRRAFPQKKHSSGAPVKSNSCG